MAALLNSPRSAWPQSIIEDPLMRHSAILVFANKQDLVRSRAPSPTCRCCRIRLVPRSSIVLWVGGWPRLWCACWAQRQRWQGARGERGGGTRGWGRRRAPSPQQSCAMRWRCRSSSTGSGTCRRAAQPHPGPPPPPCCCLQLVGHRPAHLAAPKAIMLLLHSLLAIAVEDSTVRVWRGRTWLAAGAPAGVHCHQGGGPVRGTGLAGSCAEGVGGPHLRGCRRAGLSAQGAVAPGGPPSVQDSHLLLRGTRASMQQRRTGGRRWHAERRQQVSQRSNVPGAPAFPIVPARLPQGRRPQQGLRFSGPAASAQLACRRLARNFARLSWRPVTAVPPHSSALPVWDTHGLGYPERLHLQKLCEALCKSKKLVMGQRWSLGEMATSACVHLMDAA